MSLIPTGKAGVVAQAFNLSVGLGEGGGRQRQGALWVYWPLHQW